MPINASFAPFGQVFKKLCLFKPWISRANHAHIDKVILNQTFAVPKITPRHCCTKALSQDSAPIEVILSILESPRHELRIADGVTLVHPSLHGWEAFPTPGALAQTKITWALSPTAPQVLGVTPGSFLCPRCFGHSSWRGERLICPCEAEAIPVKSEVFTNGERRFW